MNTEHLMAALKLLGQGMLGIFVVMVLIAIIIYIWTKFFNKESN